MVTSIFSVCKDARCFCYNSSVIYHRRNQDSILVCASYNHTLFGKKKSEIKNLVSFCLRVRNADILFHHEEQFYLQNFCGANMCNAFFSNWLLMPKCQKQLRQGYETHEVKNDSRLIFFHHI